MFVIFVVYCVFIVMSVMYQQNIKYGSLIGLQHLKHLKVYL